MTALPLSAAPLYDTFGPLDGATWGGTGIPNTEVAISSQFSNGTTDITIAMSATQRYSNPALTSDGAGTFFATAGSNFGGAGESIYEGALWNFNFYIDISGPETIDDYEITLFYDFDPAFDNGPAGLGTVNLGAAIFGALGAGQTHYEDSQNLMFGSFATAVPGVVSPPAFGPFDPNALGEYNFGISVSQDGWGVENVRMDVQVVPVPAAVWLFGSALAGLGWLRRKQVA